MRANQDIRPGNANRKAAVVHTPQLQAHPTNTTRSVDGMAIQPAKTKTTRLASIHKAQPIQPKAAPAKAPATTLNLKTQSVAPVIQTHQPTQLPSARQEEGSEPSLANPFGGIGARLHDLAQKPMTRKQFLATSGLALATVMGLGGILKLLGDNHGSRTAGPVHGGYGDLAYGGMQPKNNTGLTGKGRS